jgi:aminoacrylate hydrolase
MELAEEAMPQAKVPGATIHYEIVGEGDPVALVAGLGGAASYWAPNVGAFARDHSVLLHDHRGTGQSSRCEMEYSVELMADDLLRVLDDAGIEKIHLVGHSTGGAIGQVLGAIAPDRIASLVLYASWAAIDGQMEWCLETRRDILRALGPAAYHKSTPLFLYPPYFVRDNKELLRDEARSAAIATPPASILEARVTGIMNFDGTRYLERIVCPTMVLVADDDILTPPYLSQAIARGVAGAQLVRVERGGHAYSRVHPEAFNNTVLGFLKKQATKGARVHERI